MEAKKFDLKELVKNLGKKDSGLSASEIAKLIDELSSAKERIIKREEEENAKKSAKAKAEAENATADEESYNVLGDESTDGFADLSLDWSEVFQTPECRQGILSLGDSLIRCLLNLGRVDIEHIAMLSGKAPEEVIKGLAGSIYQNPEKWDENPFEGWETAEEYLSGNLRRKIKAARRANKDYPGVFRENVYALRKVMPKSVSNEDIYITLGSPWVPTDVIDDFITHIFNIRGKDYFGTKHDEYFGTWEIPCKTYYEFYNRVAATSTYGTKRISALEILERTLNMKDVSVKDDVVSRTTKSGKKKVVNQAETVLAVEKQQKLIKEFQRWVWSDPARCERLEGIFNSRFGCIRKRVFDGSNCSCSNLVTAVTLEILFECGSGY